MNSLRCTTEVINKQTNIGLYTIPPPYTAGVAMIQRNLHHNTIQAYISCDTISFVSQHVLYHDMFCITTCSVSRHVLYHGMFCITTCSVSRHVLYHDMLYGSDVDFYEYRTVEIHTYHCIHDSLSCWSGFQEKDQLVTSGKLH